MSTINSGLSFTGLKLNNSPQNITKAATRVGETIGPQCVTFTRKW